MRQSRTGLPRPQQIALYIALAIACPSIQGDEKATLPTDKQIDELIAKLGDDRFAVRQEAQDALVKIGKPALERLHKAVEATKDEEIRRRAREAISQIDPGASRRAELEARRVELRKEIAADKGVDAKNWGEDISNPFTNLTEDGKAKLLAEGVDVDRLAKLKAVLITGNYCGANAKRFVNTEPDTVLVLGKGFITHEKVCSLGPILAIEDAHIMGSLTSADFVWFVEKSWPRFATKGAPLIAGPETRAPHDREVAASLINGDYGWRRPDDFLTLPSAKADAKPRTVAIADVDTKKKNLSDQITAQKGADTADSCESVVNPFTNLTVEGLAKLKARGVDVERLAKHKAVLLSGNYDGANSKTFVNRDPDTILIVGKGFVTHGDVYSVGPILAVDDAHFMRNLTGADLVWFVDKSFPRGTTTGLPVILAPTASHSQMDPGSADVWFGDYGWRRPDDFLKSPGKPTENKK
jgi:hypothetical protein